MINIQRGETRNSFLASIAADDCGGVLSSDFQRQFRVVPPVLNEGRERRIPKKQTRVSIKSKHAEHLWQLRRSGDTSAQTEGSAVTGGFSSEESRGAYQAWGFIDGALQSEGDRSILKRCKSTRETFDHLEKWYDAESEVATQKLYDKFHDFTFP